MDITWFLAINGANEKEEHAVDRRKLHILRKGLRDVKLNIWVKDKNMKCIKITWKLKIKNYNKLKIIIKNRDLWNRLKKITFFHEF